MISRGIANNINLRYNTNLSTLKYKSIDITERWSHFESVEVSPSIDMIGEQAEYHRYGTDWEKISKNLHTIRFEMPLISLIPQITITALSVGYLPELLTYLTDELKFTDDDNLEYNLVFGDITLNPQLLPNEVKQMYTKKLERFLENTSNHELFKGIMPKWHFEISSTSFSALHFIYSHFKFGIIFFSELDLTTYFNLDQNCDF